MNEAVRSTIHLTQEGERYAPTCIIVNRGYLHLRIGIFAINEAMDNSGLDGIPVSAAGVLAAHQNHTAGDSCLERVRVKPNRGIFNEQFGTSKC